MKHLWVIEMLGKNKKWTPCEESAWLTKSVAMVDFEDWVEQDPNHKYRITKYIPNNIRSDGTLMMGEE